MSGKFAHLHCHTTFSMLDGATKLKDLIKKCKANDMNAVAVTDHGNLCGAFEFYNMCRDEGLNPIVGYEAYIAPGSRFDRTGASRQKEAAYHLTLLASSATGYFNLIKLTSKAYLEGFYYKPRIDKQLLEECNEGIICLSGCAAGELSQLLLQDRHDEAEKLVEWYSRVFGDRFYMEIQNAGLDIQKQCMDMTVDLARKKGLPLVATNDAHYLNREDAEAHDVLLCVSTLSQRSDPNRMRMTSDQFYVRTPAEMYEAFPGFEEAVAMSQVIAERCDIQLEKKPKHYPVFKPPGEMTDTQYLRKLCEDALPTRYDEVTDAIRARLDLELKVIEKMGYSSYFLIVWDFVRFAKETDIPCGARGSACGAMVAFLLGMSNVCPLKYDLLFERFLDESRTEPPDIDIDFCRDGRQRVIDYTKEKYGKESVCQIGTFGTLKAKAAVRDVARALGYTPTETNEIAKLVPDDLGIKVKEAIEQNPELQTKYDSDPKIKELFDFAMKLEGLCRSAGTHAAGVVVGDGPVIRYLPLQTISGKTDVITQWDGPHVEKAGLLKMDFLGLRNLTILHKAVQNVEKHRGIKLDVLKFPLDDPETFALLQRGETKGIFQFEGGGIRDLLTKMKPDCFADIIATSALYRPGPLEGGMVMEYVDVKHRRRPPTQVHPTVDAVLEETYGVMVYQEQVMRILNRVGGIELANAYKCIKAISKKKLETIAKFRDEYVKGAQERGIDVDVAVRLFELIEKFAGYGFNKSHSTAYGLVSYQTAYLKAHYKVEFMAALLSCGMEDSDRMTEHTDDSRRLGVPVEPPDVNKSDVEFTVEGDRVRYGLGAIKGLGLEAMTALVEARKKHGLFKSIFDIAERVDSKWMSKAILETLIAAGCLDSLGPNRAQHQQAIDRAMQSASSKAKDKARGQKSLFGGDDEADAKTGEKTEATVELPPAEDWSYAQKLAAEKEVFGFYLTSHPLTQVGDRLERLVNTKNKELGTMDDGTDVIIGGMISSIKPASTKKPSRNGHTKYANFDFEDSSGIVRCIIWPEDYARDGEKVKKDTIAIIKGRVDRRGREPNVIVNQLLTLEDAEKQFTRHLAIKFRRGVHSDHDIARTREILGKFPGKTSVVVFVESVDSENPSGRLLYTMMPPSELKVSCNNELTEALTTVLGRDNFKFQAEVQKKKPAGMGQATGR